MLDQQALIFQMRVQDILKRREQGLEILPVRLIGRQSRLKRGLGLRNQALFIDFELVFSSPYGNILLLDLRLCALQFCLEFPSCSFLVLERFSQGRRLAMTVWQADAKTRYVVVAEFVRRVLIGIADVEVRPKLPA